MTNGHNGQLKSIVERIERLEEEINGLKADRSVIYAEAKSNGFDVRALRAIIRERKLSAEERQEREAILDSYKHALGMLADLPLGQSAIERAGAHS